MPNTSTAPVTDVARAYVREHADRFEQELMNLLRIPSVSTQSDHDDDCRIAAQFLAEELDRVGMTTVEIHETPGHPIVYADWLGAGDDVPTVVIYGHYDVQPPDPLDEWKTDPFEPTVRDGNVYARGASDDKGQAYTHVKAVEAYLATSGSLPLNVKFVLEGEEESGSSSLDPFLTEHADKLAADAAVISDTHMLSADQPSVIASLRGMAYMEVEVEGPTHDLHSGLYGGTVRNPALELAAILHSMKHDDGTIAIDGFYDGVDEPSDDERESFAAIPFSDESFLAESGANELVGEQGWSTYERIGVRPTLDVNGMISGYTGEGAKTVLPARASAKVSMRLVAGQDPQRIAELFEAHVRKVAPEDLRITITDHHGATPVSVDMTHEAVQASSRAIETVFGTAPVFTREGGSIPVVASFAEILGIPTTVLMGYGLPDDRLHSPNEKFTLSQFHKGIEANIEFMAEYAG